MGSAPKSSRFLSMKSTTSCVGDRAPPRRNSLLASESRWPASFLGPIDRVPQSSLILSLSRPVNGRRRYRPGTPRRTRTPPRARVGGPPLPPCPARYPALLAACGPSAPQRPSLRVIWRVVCVPGGCSLRHTCILVSKVRASTISRAIQTYHRVFRLATVSGWRTAPPDGLARIAASPKVS